MDPITLIVGAAIALVSLLAGRAIGRRERNLIKPATVCEGCAHGLSFHDDYGKCHGTDRRRKYSDRGSDLGMHDFPCTCQQYVGPIPADRMLASFQPPGRD